MDVQVGVPQGSILGPISFLISIKVGLSPSERPVIIYLNESPLKMLKNVFYFMLKAVLVFEIYTF